MEEKINELEKILNELKKEIKNENIYYTISNLNIIENKDKNRLVDKGRQEIGNYFETIEMAEQYIENLKVEQELKEIAEELNNGRKIDWNNKLQDKIYLYYNHDFKYTLFGTEYTHQSGGVIYCLCRDFVHVAIEKIGKQRLENYLKRK